MLLALMAPMTSFAIDAGQVLANINDQIPYLFTVVSAVAYITGGFFLVRGMMKLKEFGESHGRSAGQHMSLAGPASFIAIGAMLIYLPQTKDALLMTVYGTNEVSPYSGYATAPANSEQLMEVLIKIVQFVGFISFVRALILFHKVGNNQGQPGTFNKGLSHAVGGAIAMNIVTFINIITNTLGI